MSDIEAAVEAPQSAPTETPVETPELTEDQQLDAIWEKAQSEGVEAEEVDDASAAGDTTRDEKGRFKAKEEPDVEATQEEPEETPVVEKAPIFSALPSEIRNDWENLKPEVQSAILSSYHQMQVQSTNAGRMMKGLGPIRDTLAAAVKDLPELADMTPDQVAQDAMELAKTRVQLMRDPVNTLIQVAQSTGSLDGLKQALSGEAPAAPTNDQAVIADLRGQIQNLQTQLQTSANPDTIRGIAAQSFEESRVQSEIQQWSSGKEHYQVVEQHLPQFVQMAQQTAAPSASHTDILDTAYDMAVRSFGLRASTPPATTEAPQRAQAALNAKSANVQSRGTKPAQLTEDQMMAAAYDKAMRS